MRTTITSTSGNRVNLAKIETAWAELLAETLRRGFYGKAGFELAIHDGTIQQIRRVVEKVER
jgi:hypothetical protein